MSLFRKKPVVIEAYRFDNRISSTIPRWIWDAVEAKIVEVFLNPLEIRIKTLEGVMKASEGDWIIRGIKGEIYPCKPDIFEVTYELMEDAEAIEAQSAATQCGPQGESAVLEGNSP